MITEKARTLSTGMDLAALLQGKRKELMRELIENCLPTRAEYIELMQDDYKPENTYDIYWSETSEGTVTLKPIWQNPEAVKKLFQYFKA